MAELAGVQAFHAGRNVRLDTPPMAMCRSPMSLARTVMTIRLHSAEFLYAEPVADLPGRFENVLEAFLANRGSPGRDIDLALADHPESILGHCLRIAIIVRGDDPGRLSGLAESVTAIETLCREADRQARRRPGDRVDR